MTESEYLSALSKLNGSIGSIEEILYFIAARKSEVQMKGFGVVLDSINEREVIDTLEMFPEHLRMCRRQMLAVDRDGLGELDNLLQETEIQNLAARFLIKLKIAQQTTERQKIKERATSMLQSVASTITFGAVHVGDGMGGMRSLSAEDELPVENLLVSISRIRQLLRSLSEDEARRNILDDEYFKPSGVDAATLVEMLEVAINSLSEGGHFTRSDEIVLVGYLEDVKREVVSDHPSWRKIVGALVILSTITAGIAVAPDATHNIRKAVEYVLGTGVSIDPRASEPSELMLPRWIPPQRRAGE